MDKRYPDYLTVEKILSSLKNSNLFDCDRIAYGQIFIPRTSYFVKFTLLFPAPGASMGWYKIVKIPQDHKLYNFYDPDRILFPIAIPFTEVFDSSPKVIKEYFIFNLNWFI